jgi:glutaredoxin-like protein NrdH
MNIKVYSKNNCIQCEMTKMWLNQNKIKYESVDVFEHPEKLEEIKLNGFQQIPVVALDEHFENAWSGYNLDRLEELKESY